MICRAESPHLSRLHQRYQSKGFTVLGINATNDPRDMVERFQRDLKLEQPILLRGSDVAMKGYAIKRFPALFWIDREGRILEHSTGFDSPDRLEEKLKRLLR